MIDPLQDTETVQFPRTGKLIQTNLAAIRAKSPEKGVRYLMYCRGIRGATTIECNDREEILSATTELLQIMIRQNDLHVEDIASAIFSLTDDLDAEFPAVAARQLGWTEVPLMCTREIPVPGSLGKCIRVLLHVNTTRGISEIQHVYLRGAACLRPTFAVQL